jgi:lipoprotein
MKRILMIGLLLLTACWASAENPPQRCNSVNGGVGVRVSRIEGTNITLTFENTLSDPMKVEVTVSTPQGFEGYSYSGKTAVQIPKANPYSGTPGTTTRTFTLHRDHTNGFIPPDYGNVVPQITKYEACTF